MIEELRTIFLPDNPTWIEQLGWKFKEYEARNYPYLPLSQRMWVICGRELLAHLLRENSVEVTIVRQMLIDKYKDDFDPIKFSEACAVILDLCTTCGRHVRGRRLPNIAA